MVATWHVQIFRISGSSRRRGRRRPDGPVFGWSASAEPEGYRYDKGPYETPEDAEAAARAELEADGDAVESVGFSR